MSENLSLSMPKTDIKHFLSKATEEDLQKIRNQKYKEEEELRKLTGKYISIANGEDKIPFMKRASKLISEYAEVDDNIINRLGRVYDLSKKAENLEEERKKAETLRQYGK